MHLPTSDIDTYRRSLADVPALPPEILERVLDEVHDLVATRAEHRARLADLAVTWPELAALIDELAAT